MLIEGDAPGGTYTSDDASPSVAFPAGKNCPGGILFTWFIRVFFNALKCIFNAKHADLSLSVEYSTRVYDRPRPENTVNPSESSDSLTY